MATKLRKVQRTLLKDRSGTDLSQVVAASVSGACKVYKQGATVTTAGPTTIASHTVVAVRDSGRLVVGDTVQKGSSSTNTATVYEVTSPTSIKLDSATGTLVLSANDRIVVTSNRPTLYTESSGSVGVGSSNVDTDAAGNASFYTTEPIVDLIYSGTGITTSTEYDVEAGYLEPVINIRDYGNSLALAVAALPSDGGTIYLPDGTYEVSAAVHITTPNTRIVGDSWGGTIVRAAASDPAYGLLVVERGGFICENIRFDHRGTTAGNYDIVQLNGQGVVNNGVEQVIFVQCSFLYARRNSFRITGGVYIVTLRNLVMLYGFGSGFYCQDSATATDPATPYSDDVPAHIKLVDCHINGLQTDANTPACYAQNTSPLIFERCIIEGNKGGTDVSTANAIATVGCSFLEITSCHFEIAGSGPNLPAARPEQFILLATSQGASIQDCQAIGSSNTSVQPHIFVNAGTSSRGTARGNRISNLSAAVHQAFYLDANSNGWVIHSGIYDTTMTEVLQEPCIRFGYGLKVPVFADDTERSSLADTRDGTLIYVTSPTSPATTKLQIRKAGAWVGIV